MTRQCSRPDCSDPAVATLSYQYAARSAWLVDAADQPHPATYDLCPRHADGLTLPIGWTMHDQRRSAVRGLDVTDLAS